MTSPKASSHTIICGRASHSSGLAELEKGITLAKDSDSNPLISAFKKVFEAVSKKQENKMRSIKTLVHYPEGAADLEAVFALAE